MQNRDARVADEILGVRNCRWFIVSMMVSYLCFNKSLCLEMHPEVLVGGVIWCPGGVCSKVTWEWGWGV